MAASTDKPREAQPTRVADMPPLTVTTQGIPTTEHVEGPPPVVGREQRTRWYALAVAGVLALIALFALAWNALFLSPTTPAPTSYSGAVATSEWPPRLTPSRCGRSA